MNSKKIMFKQYPWVQNILLLACGIIFSILILEGGLRFSSFVLLKIQENRNRISINKKGTYKIMCIGESTTADAAGNSPYPRQLDKILNEKSRGINFIVINKGVIGISTDGIMAQIEENIVSYKPDMIIAMMGANDNNAILDPFISRPWRVNLITSSRIYKFIQYVLTSSSFSKNRNSKNPSAFEYNKKAERNIGKSLFVSRDDRKKKIYKKKAVSFRNAADYKMSIVYAKKILELDPENSWAYFIIGRNHANLRDYTNAKKYLWKSIELNSKNDRAYSELSSIYFHNHKKMEHKAESAIRKAINLNPYSVLYYEFMFRIMCQQKRYIEIEQLVKNGLKIIGENEVLTGLLAQLYLRQKKTELAEKYFSRADDMRNRYYNSVTYANYNKIKNSIIRNGIKLIAVQYPVLNLEPLKEMLNYDKDVVFVDNEHVFKEALKKEPYNTYFTDYFGGVFGHCTEKGNHLLAENISRSVLRHVNR